MLVFFSDIHLTDGTSGETINEGAFELFADQLVDLADKRQARELRLVLLGDGLDIVRSSRWIGPHAVRPWTPAGSNQEELTLDPDATDRVHELATEASFTVPNTLVRLALGWSASRRRSQVDSYVVDRDLHTWSVAVAAGL